MKKIIDLINDIAQDMENGNTIVREIRPQELCAVWINTANNKEYFFKANMLRKLIDFEQKDPRLIPVLQFIANQITAIEAKKDIDRLENLKAFW